MTAHLPSRIMDRLHAAALAENEERGRRATCGATAVFWPDDEACDAVCILPPGHEPADRHEDENLGEWTEDELPTHHPDRRKGE